MEYIEVENIVCKLERDGELNLKRGLKSWSINDVKGQNNLERIYPAIYIF